MQGKIAKNFRSHTKYGSIKVTEHVDYGFSVSECEKPWQLNPGVVVEFDPGFIDGQYRAYNVRIVPQYRNPPETDIGATDMGVTNEGED